MPKLNNKVKYNKTGFTLIELIIVIVLFGILVALSAPIYSRFQNFNNIELATMEFVQSLRRAQVLSRAVDGDSSWGVYIATEQIILFKGSTYASRDPNYDENYSIVNNISISGLQEIVFDKFSGLPQNIGSTTLTINTNANKTVTINSQGTISY